MVQKIPILGGDPKIILIVAGWRTGSTFLSELVSSNLKNMRLMVYEPLMSKFRVNRIRKETEVTEVHITLVACIQVTFTLHISPDPTQKSKSISGHFIQIT